MTCLNHNTIRVVSWQKWFAEWTEVSLRIRTVCSEFSQSTLYSDKAPKRLQDDSEDSDQTVEMRRLISVIAGRMRRLVRFFAQ